MLTVKKCRQLLERPELTDEQVEIIRDRLYDIGEILLRSYIEETGNLEAKENASEKQHSTQAHERRDLPSGLH